MTKYWKILSIILFIILIPFVLNLIANYTTWLSTKEKVEVTLKLDGWITVGSLLEGGLPNLQLLYNNKPVKNALKISWRIVNTGSKGIAEFEQKPSLSYPEKFDIAEATISNNSNLLKIDNNLLKNPEKRIIEVKNIGIFNRGDFFVIDVYIVDIPDSQISPEYFKEWDLIAKSVDIKIRKNITPETVGNKIIFPWKPTLIIYIIMVVILLIRFVSKVFLYR